MKIAFIPPYSLLEWTEQTHYQLCLPHLFSNNSYHTRYARYCKDPNQFVIMDNGAAENKLATVQVLMALATKLKPNEVVIPDAMGDYRETIRLAQIFYDECIPPLEFPRPPFSFMFVVQGQNQNEVLESAEWAASKSWIHTLGIPRHLITTLKDQLARVHIANKIQEFSKKEIHFLGANAAFPGEVACLAYPAMTNQEHVRGMDTSMPFNYAFAKKSLASTATRITYKVQRPQDYFYQNPQYFDDGLVKENCEYFLRYDEDSEVGDFD